MRVSGGGGTSNQCTAANTHVSSGEKRCNTDVGGHEHVHVCGGRLFIRTVDKEGDAEEASDEPVDLEDGGKRPHQGERGGFVADGWTVCRRVSQIESTKIF